MLCKSFGSEYKMNNQKNQAVLGFFDIIMFEIALWLWSLDVNCSVASNFNIDTATLYMNAVFVYVNISIAISIFIASFNSSWAIAVSFYFSVISFYVNATTVLASVNLNFSFAAFRGCWAFFFAWRAGLRWRRYALSWAFFCILVCRISAGSQKEEWN